MTRPRSPRPVLSPLWLLVALLTTLALNTSPAAASGGPETRVRAIPTTTPVAVGQHSSEIPGGVGCLRPPGAAIASGSCVATEAAGAADHVVLGKSIGLEEQAAKIGGRHLMGSADWQAEVMQAIGNPNTKISVALDGLEGSGSAYSRVMSAVQRGASGAGSPLDWELSQLYQSGRLSTTSFFEGGGAITNPFG